MIQLNEILALAAILLVLIAYIPYMFDIVKGKVAPHPFSWLVWSMTATAVFFIQTTNGSGTGAYATGILAICAAIVFVLAFRTNRVKIRPLDILSLILALVGIVVWIFVDQPSIAIMILLGVEIVGFIPTYLNGWRRPYKDSATLWSLNFGRQLLGFLSIQNYNFVTILNPVTWMIVSCFYVATLMCRRLFFKKHATRRRLFRPYN